MAKWKRRGRRRAASRYFYLESCDHNEEVGAVRKSICDDPAAVLVGLAAPCATVMVEADPVTGEIKNEAVDDEKVVVDSRSSGLNINQ